MGNAIQSFDKHSSQLGGFVVKHGYLRPPSQLFLGDDDMQRAHQDMVVQGMGLGVKTNLKRIIVMGVDPEIGQEEVNEEIDIISKEMLASREGFVSFKQHTFKISYHGLDKGEYDIVGVEDVNVSCSFAQLNTGHSRSFGGSCFPMRS